ncbi:transposase protein, partial [Pseudomonas savastanoi pv. phaseolicola]
RARLAILSHNWRMATTSSAAEPRPTCQQETLSQADMLRRVVQHIPEKHFRMIRYFGFLANRVCGKYLPKVYEALKMATPGPTPKLYFVQMAKAFLNVDPFRCVLC